MNIQKLLILVFLPALVLCTSCHKRPSKVEQMRAEKNERDSLAYIQAGQTLHYADSLLQTLMPEVEPLMKSFRYEKNESYEDHGHYVHKLLATSSNSQRCFLQAYVSDDRQTAVQSYFYGSAAIHQHYINLSVNDLYVEAEGQNHSFEVEGVHEILSVIGDDAINILRFIESNQDQRIKVTAKGDREAVYYLTADEKKALSETYQLARLMADIAEMEHTIRLCNLRIEKYRQKHHIQ